MTKSKPLPQPVADQASSSGFGFRAYVPFLIFISMLVLIPRIERWIGTDRINDFISAAGWWAPIIFVLLRILTIVVSPLMLGPFAILANRAFGFGPAVVLNFVAQMVGGAINYWIGRSVGSSFLNFFLGKKMAGLAGEYAHKYLTKNTVATGMLLYGYNYELVAYACGIARVPFGKFLLALGAATTVSVPLMVWQSISIGVNNALAIALNIGGYISAILAIGYVAGSDIRQYLRAEFAKANQAAQQSKDAKDAKK